MMAGSPHIVTMIAVRMARIHMILKLTCTHRRFLPGKRILMPV